MKDYFKNACILLRTITILKIFLVYFFSFVRSFVVARFNLLVSGTIENISLTYRMTTNLLTTADLVTGPEGAVDSYVRNFELGFLKDEFHSTNQVSIESIIVGQFE